MNLKLPLNRKSSKILANFSFLTFSFNFEFLPSLQIFEMWILTYSKAQFTSFASIFELLKTTDGPRVSNKLHNFPDFSWKFAKTLNFNRDFLKEGMRYLTFPVDFLKAETIVFHKSCNENSPIPLHLGVKSLQNNEGHWN